jgi:starch phosphorylase
MEEFIMKLEEQLVAKLGKPVASASDEELYHALVDTVKEHIRAREMTSGNKKLYYISAEFLTGRQLGRNLVNLRLYKEALELLKANGKDLKEIEEF